VERPKAAITGIVILVLAGIIGGWAFLRPAEDAPTEKPEELTDAMTPQIEVVQILEDSDVPKELSPLKVGGSDVYLLVTVFYPGLPDVPEPRSHRLTNINRDVKLHAEALVADADVDDEGARVDLFFLVGQDFERARLVRGSTIVAEKIELE
jgi:hypothetical protein